MLFCMHKKQQRVEKEKYLFNRGSSNFSVDPGYSKPLKSHNLVYMIHNKWNEVAKTNIGFTFSLGLLFCTYGTVFRGPKIPPSHFRWFPLFSGREQLYACTGPLQCALSFARRAPKGPAFLFSFAPSTYTQQQLSLMKGSNKELAFILIAGGSRIRCGRYLNSSLLMSWLWARLREPISKWLPSLFAAT